MVTRGGIKVEVHFLCLQTQIRKIVWLGKLLPAVEDDSAALIM